LAGLARKPYKGVLGMNRLKTGLLMLVVLVFGGAMAQTQGVEMSDQELAQGVCVLPANGC
jgi:hypothetical protein